MGLEPSTAYNHVYLIPYGTECTAQVSALGLQAMLRRNGIQVISEVVYEEDEFSYEYTPDFKFHFKPSIKGKRELSNIIGAFALAKEPTPDGYVYHLIYLPKSKIDAIRMASSGNSNPMSPWVKYYEEMASKAVIKKLAKKLASVNEKLAEVISVEDGGSVSSVNQDIINSAMDSAPETVEEPQSKADSLADMIENNNIDGENGSSS
jgi:recombination protein RecT